MKTLFANAQVFTITSKGYQMLGRDFTACNGIISTETSNCDKTVDLADCIIIPMFVDIHCHGAVGFNFNTVTDFFEIDEIANYFIKRGTGSLIASLMADNIDAMLWQIKLIGSYINSKHNTIIKGIHLEGPFLSQQYKGAMNAKFILEANLSTLKKLINEANGLIKQVTLSPEISNVNQLAQYLIDSNIVVSLGHSGASSAQTNTLIKIGANSFTHIFNAMAPLSHKTDGILSTALLNDECYAEFIADGKHLTPDTVILSYKLKTSDRLILITDSILSGCSDGEYKLMGQSITVSKGGAFLAETPTRAGSTLDMFTAFNNFIDITNCNIIDAVKCSSVNAAKLLKLKHPFLNPNDSANFIAINKFTNNIDVYINGELYKQTNS